MSRSYRKHPFYSGGTKRWGKQHASRILRHKIKQNINGINVDLSWQDQDGLHHGNRREGCPAQVVVDDLIIPLPDELYDFWWDNDGGCNFDPERYPHLLRK